SAGSGHITSIGVDRVMFSLLEPGAVLQFHYFPFLTVQGCDVLPFDHPAGMQFIELRNCPVNQELMLRSINPLQRLLRGLRRTP
ncbi:MAG: hypothetical protein KDD60_05610, partial [Bdellovibrionales bacterium]|nr:hypothetical protein [Bdellovibrionales bacterium]